MSNATERVRQSEARSIKEDGNKLEILKWVEKGIQECLYNAYEKFTIHTDFLDRIPQSVSKLASINSLDVRGNRIKEIPEFVKDMVNLKILNLEDNDITSLPGWLASDRSDLNVYVKGNPIQDTIVNQPSNVFFIDELEHLNHLQHLDNIQNCIENGTEILMLNGYVGTSLPLEIFQQTQLKTLYLQDSNIEHIPKDIEKLVNLEKLVLRNSKVSTIHYSIFGLKQLQVLDLGGVATWEEVGGVRIFPQVVMQMDWCVVDLRETPNIATPYVRAERVMYQADGVPLNTNDIPGTTIKPVVMSFVGSS